MKVAVVGAGVAGALLASRLAAASRTVTVEVFAGAPAGTAATTVSGGLVRGFDPDARVARLAAESLAELRGDPGLREAAGYREVGSVHVLPPGPEPAGPLAEVERLLPGSARVLTGRALAALPLRGVRAGSVAVTEAAAGWLGPDRVRAYVLGRLPAGRATVRPEQVAAVTADPAVRLTDGRRHGFDLVVVAAGPWTPGLLRAGGLPGGGLRTKQIQYVLHPARLPGLGVVVDDGTGLWGRPAPEGWLLGLPSDRWDVDPAIVTADGALAREILAVARRQLGDGVAPGPPGRVVAACDCYADPPGLALRAVVPPALLTFTGGSGGAAKTALAASRHAATALLDGAGAAA